VFVFLFHFVNPNVYFRSSVSSNSCFFLFFFIFLKKKLHFLQWCLVLIWKMLIVLEVPLWEWMHFQTL
jgi:hypothetical protein